MKLEISIPLPSNGFDRTLAVVEHAFSSLQTAPTRAKNVFRALLVEDDLVTMGVYERAFSTRGWVCDRASTVADALAFWHHRENHYDLVILDIRLGGRTYGGVEIYKAIREKDKTTPVLFITGYANTVDWDSIASLGFYATVRKPVLYDDLLAALAVFEH